MRNFLWKIWCSYNYRMCMVDSYLASNRGDHFLAAQFQSIAHNWQREYQMAGRSLS